MFTGIITAIGKIENRIEKEDAVTLSISTPYNKENIVLGASIAHNGVCLTVEAYTDTGYQVTLSHETLHRTTASQWQVGQMLNLEQSLKMGDELGGHLVFGHVDGVAELRDIRKQGESYVLHIAPPVDLLSMIAVKGSVSVDGISLTVNGVDKDSFMLTIIPHTWEETTLSHMKQGDKVNVEVDMLARYVARQMEVLNAG